MFWNFQDVSDECAIVIGANFCRVLVLVIIETDTDTVGVYSNTKYNIFLRLLRSHGLSVFDMCEKWEQSDKFSD